MGSMDFGPASFAAFILFIGILIFVHELGHFLAAKHFGIKVLKFSLGFGPSIFKFTKGDTTYQIAALPLGGFVKMLGDSPTDEVAPEERSRSFSHVPVHQRAVVAFAGPLFNLVFPVVCFFSYYLLGPTVTAPIVGMVETGSPAERAGLRQGDRVLAIDGERVWAFDRMADHIRDRAGETLDFEIERAGETKHLMVTPKVVQELDEFGKTQERGLIGVTPDHAGTRIGVDGPLGKSLGLETGDRILKVGNKAVGTLKEVEDALREHAGQTTKVVVARPHPMKAGDLFLMTEEDIVTLSPALPARARSLADFGLAPSECFVRALDPSGPVAKAGLRPGDRIVEFNGRPVSFFVSFVMDLQRLGSEPITLGVVRDGKHMSFTFKSDEHDIENEFTGKTQTYYDAGFGLGEVPRNYGTLRWGRGGSPITEVTRISLAEAFMASVSDTLDVIAMISVALYKLFAGDISVKTVGGPIMLFQVAAQAAEVGVFAYLRLLALISVNLGIINLIPIPLFDGGHLLFCAIEAIKRKPVSVRAREAFTLVGLVLLAFLIVLVFSNDISRLSESLR